MKPIPRIQFVSPYLDGDYYGKVFLALHRDAKARNAGLYVIQSLVSFQNPSPFDHRIGIDSADGWLLMTNPQSPLPLATDLLRAMEATGKPIVTIGYREHAVRTHAVITDNRGAAKEAVNHLIREHGHRRIAFVGSTEHVDLIDRMEGYKEALAENGIAFDESLLYLTDNALLRGGKTAGAAMLQDGITFTAVFASTDLNALALIETLQKAGLRIPEDVAVIGFDDQPSAATSNPPLTTVRQSFTELALASMEALYRLMRGLDAQGDVTYLRTELVCRSSCGCPKPAMPALTADIQRNLLQAQADVDTLINRHYQLAGNWAVTAREERFRFETMFGDYYPWGCLAIWDEREPGHRRLVVKQAYSRNGMPIPEIGMTIPVEQFPPTSWFTKVGQDQFVHVHAIRNIKKDWGFIVVVRPVDELVHIPAADIAQTGFTIAHAALERDDLIRQVRLIAEKLEIVSRTTNDGIWDWNIETNRMEWSIRTRDMLGTIGERVTSDPDSFMDLVHPDDYAYVTDSFRQSVQTASPLKLEFRIRGDNEMWIYAAGDTIVDRDGKVIRIIGSLTNITEKKIAERRIMHLAYHDGLTGLANRQLFQDRVQKCIMQADRRGKKFGLLLLDLDQFKSVNDTMGHQAGDELLRQVAGVLDSAVAHACRVGGRKRSELDTAARLGGDEFIIVLAEVQGQSDLQAAADYLARRFEQPFAIMGQAVRTAGSIGFAVYPEDGTDLDALTRCADLMMYKAKVQGKTNDETR